MPRAPKRPARPAEPTSYTSVPTGLVRVVRKAAKTRRTFELRWSGPNGRDTHTMHDSADAAEQMADKIEALLTDGLELPVGRAARARQAVAHVPERRRTVIRTLMSVEEEWAASFGKKAQSLGSARYNLEHYVYPEIEVFDPSGRRTGTKICLARMGLDDINEDHVVIWARSMRFTLSKRGVPYSPSTIALALRNLNTLFTYAKKKGYITRHPGQGIKVDLYDVKKRDYFETQDEFFAVVRHLRDWCRAPIIVLAYTGARFGEGAGLKVNALDTKTCRIYFKRTLLQSGEESTPKSVSSQDFVPYHPSLTPILEAHLEGLKDRSPNAPLFPGQRRGKNLQNRSLNINLAAACEAAGIGKHVTCHGLRVSLASWLNELKVPLATIQEILRHADLRTTRGYIRVSERQRAEAMTALTAVPTGLVD